MRSTHLGRLVRPCLPKSTHAPSCHCGEETDSRQIKPNLRLLSEGVPGGSRCCCARPKKAAVTFLSRALDGGEARSCQVRNTHVTCLPASCRCLVLFSACCLSRFLRSRRATGQPTASLSLPPASQPRPPHTPVPHPHPPRRHRHGELLPIRRQVLRRHQGGQTTTARGQRLSRGNQLGWRRPRRDQEDQQRERETREHRGTEKRARG